MENLSEYRWQYVWISKAITFCVWKCTPFEFVSFNYHSLKTRSSEFICFEFTSLRKNMAFQDVPFQKTKHLFSMFTKLCPVVLPVRLLLGLILGEDIRTGSAPIDTVGSIAFSLDCFRLNYNIQFSDPHVDHLKNVVFLIYATLYIFVWKMCTLKYVYM